MPKHLTPEETELRASEMAEMAAYRRTWKDNFRKKTLTHLIAEEERWSELISLHPHRLAEDAKILQELLDRIDTLERQLIESSKGDCPIAFLIPTYEQAQMMNAWSPDFEPDLAPSGYQSAVNFGGVRSLKTWAVQMGTVLWMVPNEPEWPIFQEHEDHLGRGKYQVFRRPIWDVWHRQGRLTYSDEEPPISGRNIWHGCVDEDHWKSKLDRAYRRMMPLKWVKRVGKEYKWSISDKYFETKWDVRLSAKLYNSDVQSWSGDEVFLLNLDEGPPEDKLEEAVMRSRYIQWAYTPREAANVAERAQIARDVYYGDRNLVGKVKFFLSKTADVPDSIMPAEIKKIRLENAARMGEAGRVAVEGGFFDSSPTVFSAFSRDRHILPITGADVLDAINGKTIPDRDGVSFKWMEAFKNANIIRGFDEGLAHPTACSWFAILETGEYVMFKEYCKANTSIPERCEAVIALSGNSREPINFDGPVTNREMELARQFAPEILKDRKREEATGRQVRRWRERDSGMFIRKTFADSKIFRRDPQHPLDSWVENYSREGLRMERATNALPEARADYVNGMFRADGTRQHLNPAQRTPEKPYGYRLYITMDCPIMIRKFERYLWEQKAAGPYRGDPTGKPDRRDDDLVDATCYGAASKLRWMDPNELKAMRAA
jgi:hypothetical protein